jgi:hypothetical protein
VFDLFGIRLWQIDRVLVQSSEKWICCQQCLPDPTTTPAGHIPKQRMTWAEEAAERRGSQNVRIGSMLSKKEVE